MTHAQQLAAAREAVRQVACDSRIGELILIRDGHYAGHRFTFDDGYAVWFLDEQQVKIHWHEGSRLSAVALVGTDERRARAWSLQANRELAFVFAKEPMSPKPRTYMQAQVDAIIEAAEAAAKSTAREAAYDAVAVTLERFACILEEEDQEISGSPTAKNAATQALKSADQSARRAIRELKTVAD